MAVDDREQCDERRQRAAASFGNFANLMPSIRGSMPSCVSPERTLNVALFSSAPTVPGPYLASAFTLEGGFTGTMLVDASAARSAIKAKSETSALQMRKTVLLP